MRRAIYAAPTVDAAEAEFGTFADKWGDEYPAMIRSWHNSSEESVPFGEFPPELRKVVYTTNATESINAQLRRAVGHRGHFPNKQAAMRVLYHLATTHHKNRTNMTGKTNGHKTIPNTLTVHYSDHITNHIP